MGEVLYQDLDTAGLGETAGFMGKKFWRKMKKMAKGGLKIMSPILSVAKGIAPLVPGIGTAVGAGLGAATALASGKSLKDAALEAAMGAVPGGQLAKTAMKAGYGAIRGRHRAVMVNAIRAGMPNATQAVFDTGAVLAAEAMHRAGQTPSVIPVIKTTRRDNLGQSAMGQAARVLRAKPGLLVSGGVERAASKIGLRTPHVVAALRAHKKRVRHVPLSQRATALVARHAGRLWKPGTAGLDETGRYWVVQSGDTGSKIAKAVVGDGNRWGELKAANPEIAKRKDPPPGFKTKVGLVIYPGDRLMLPSSWLKAAPTASAPATPGAPAPVIPVSFPQALPTGLPTVVQDTSPDAGVVQARGILVMFMRTDAQQLGGDPLRPPYGDLGLDVSPIWSDRDRNALSVFEAYWATAKLGPEIKDDGTADLTEEAAAALRTWAEAKAVSPGTAVSAPGGGIAQNTPQPVAMTPVSYTIPEPAAGSGGAPSTQTTPSSGGAPSGGAPSGGAPSGGGAANDTTPGPVTRTPGGAAQPTAGMGTSGGLILAGLVAAIALAATIK